jgi:hypothetical protein
MIKKKTPKNNPIHCSKPKELTNSPVTFSKIYPPKPSKNNPISHPSQTKNIHNLSINLSTPSSLNNHTPKIPPINSSARISATTACSTKIISVDRIKTLSSFKQAREKITSKLSWTTTLKNE